MRGLRRPSDSNDGLSRVVVFLILFGLAAIVLILVVATVRGRRAGLPPGSSYSGDTGGTGVAGWTSDWDHRSTDPTNDRGAGDWGGGSSDRGSDSGGAGGDGGGSGGDGRGGGGDGGGGAG